MTPDQERRYRAMERVCFVANSNEQHEPLVMLIRASEPISYNVPERFPFDLGTEYRNGLPWRVTFLCQKCGGFGITPWHRPNCPIPAWDKQAHV
jgi:hypothetical protein